MRLIRFTSADAPEPTFGILDEEDRVYLAEGDLLEGATRGALVAPLADVRLLAPCVPTKVVAVAINYPGIDHFDPNMAEPMVFLKPPSSVIGPGEPVINPFPGTTWWGEAELGLVMKKRTRPGITEEEARDYVLGFTIGNDSSVENIEDRDHHLARSKCADRFCPIGPWIDTEYDATDVLIEAVQNGRVIRAGRSSQQFWEWPRIIAEVCNWMTLEPWDVILTGNAPDTVGVVYIQHGDTYTARVEGLGELTNPYFERGR